MTKEMWIDAHEQILEEYCDEDGECHLDEDAIMKLTNERFENNMGDMIDAARDRYKYDPEFKKYCDELRK